MQYNVGDKVRIILMADKFVDYNGRTGVITHIDDLGQLHGTWGSCAIIPGLDVFEVIEDE